VQTFVMGHIGRRNSQRRRGQKIPGSRDYRNLFLNLGQREDVGVRSKWKCFAEAWLLAEHLQPGAEMNEVLSHMRDKECCRSSVQMVDGRAKKVNRRSWPVLVTLCMTHIQVSACMPLIERQDSKLPWFNSYGRRRNHSVDETDEWESIGTGIPCVGEKHAARDELDRLVFLWNAISDCMVYPSLTLTVPAPEEMCVQVIVPMVRLVQLARQMKPPSMSRASMSRQSETSAIFIVENFQSNEGATPKASGARFMTWIWYMDSSLYWS